MTEKSKRTTTLDTEALRAFMQDYCDKILEPFDKLGFQVEGPDGPIAVINERLAPLGMSLALDRKVIMP